MKWMEKIYPPKFLRYLYYRLYRLALKTNNDTPKLSVSITMAFTHLIQILLIILFIGACFSKDYFGTMFEGSNKIILALLFLFFLYIVEILYQYKDKQLKYIQEFESETAAERKLGTVYLWLYLILSIPVALILSGYIIVNVSPNYY